ncbi:type II toxin-antitoxin system CcdA family antitoxin [Hafnia alvei]|uniref:type II toxin-antitoxin system CcdA family antitoxin n=1 Tax=Hafnia alvei TaxID=569 RepID=UPI002DB86916|nr:type II toxin-antitoxin system CcdA family antitoxin [Hafnia alvei]MEB7889207.1 type II toxin-antitoxin system CcdA family antitoxin [Hafnia alvei]
MKRRTLLTGSKKAVNVSIDQGLIQQAKALNINLSAVMEEALQQVVIAEGQRQWLDSHRQSIATYNQDVEENGVFSDGLRSF